MTSARVEPIALSIEHLDFEVQCECNFHTGASQRAAYMHDAHGCGQSLKCVACSRKARERFDFVMQANGGYAPCAVCDKVFRTYEEIVTVRPL